MILIHCAIGCTSDGTLHTTGRGLELLGLREPAGPLKAVDIVPTEPALREYRVTAGDEQGSVILQAVERTRHFGAQWSLNSDGVRVEYWRVDDDGNLTMPAVISYDDNALSVFNPPLVLIHATMTPGEQYRQETTMIVLDSRDPDRERQRGTAVRTVEYIHDQVVRTPAGEHVAARLAVHFKATMNMASMERASTLYVVPGLGVIAEETSERMSIINVFNREANRTVVLARTRAAVE
jgi:hypothetical protein